MTTLIDVRRWFSKPQASTARTSYLSYLAKNENTANLTHKVGVFSDYQDTKVALEELELAGFFLSEIKLIAADGWRCHWLCDLAIYDRFDEKLFDTNQAAKDFFRELFEQGKYLLLFTGTENDLSLVSAIIGYHRDRSEVWYF